MSRRQQQQGKAGEQLVANILGGLGVLMVEKIATPVIVSRASGRPVIIAWEKPVSGDHRGIMPDGRSVLAETKTIPDRNLAWSDLREHQPERLTEHTNAQGLTLLVWVHSTGVYVMEWSEARENFGPGRTLAQHIAEEIDMHTRDLLESYTKAPA